MSYTHLTQEQRHQIYALKPIGHNQSEIAKIIGVNKSTISREFKRNMGLKGYRPKQAQEKSVLRQKNKVVARIPYEAWKTVEHLICEDWSPEQITGWLKSNNKISVSHEHIYQYILKDKHNGGHLYRHLRCKRKHKKRYGYIILVLGDKFPIE